MINLRVYFLLLPVIYSCTSNQHKNDSGFTISGNYSNPATEVRQAFLFQRNNIYKKEFEIVDTIQIDDEGNFSKFFHQPPYTYSLVFDGNNSVLLAINEGQKLRITTTVTNGLIEFDVQGSEDTRLLHEYEKIRKSSLQRLVIPVRDEIKRYRNDRSEEAAAKVAELGKLEIEYYESHKDELVDFIQQKMGTSVGIYETSIRWSGSKHLPQFKQLASDFEQAHPGTEISKVLNERVDILAQTTIGGKVGDLNMPDSSGNSLNLYANLSEVTLIDFWASWCPPCRRESELLVELHESFRSNGFQIFGVSLDDKEKRWKSALKKDRRNWPNVSTLDRFNSPAAYQYAVSSLPANFIVDKEGVILARDLHDEELEKWLSDYFQKNE